MIAAGKQVYRHGATRCEIAILRYPAKPGLTRLFPVSLQDAAQAMQFGHGQK
jgi:hypothetical protein